MPACCALTLFIPSTCRETATTAKIMPKSAKSIRFACVKTGLSAIKIGNNTIVPIYPSTYIYSDLVYVPSSNTHNGRFTIPYTMSFPSITGTKQLSTASQYNSFSQDGYLAILMITAFDSEGESEDFIIALLIQPSLQLDLFLILVIIGVVVVIGIIVGILLYLRSKKKSRISTSPGGYYDQYYRDESIQEPYEYAQGSLYYCPYCGYQLTAQRNFCPSCGKSLKFQE